MNFLSYDLWLCSVNKCSDSYAAKFNFDKIIQLFSNPPVISFPPVSSHFRATEKGLKISTPKTNNRLVIPLSINISPLQSSSHPNLLLRPWIFSIPPRSDLLHLVQAYFLLATCSLYEIRAVSACSNPTLSLPLQFKSHFHFTSPGLHDIMHTSPFLSSGFSVC